MHVTLDPVHMLKLCRYAFSVFWVFHSGSGSIDYRYIEDSLSSAGKDWLEVGYKGNYCSLCYVHLNFTDELNTVVLKHFS